MRGSVRVPDLKAEQLLDDWAVAASLLVELETHGASGAGHVGFVFGAVFIIACQPVAGGLEDGCAGLDSADHQVVDTVSVLCQVFIEPRVAERLFVDLVLEPRVLPPLLRVVRIVPEGLQYF